MNQLSPTLRFIRDKRTESNIVEQCLISVKEFIRDKHLDFFVFMDFYSSIAIRFTPDYPQLDEYNFNLLLDCISIILDSSLQSNGNVEETIKFNLHIQSERFYPIFASPILYLLQLLPGIVCSVLKIINQKDSLIHSQVLIQSIHLQQTIIHLVFDNSLFEELNTTKNCIGISHEWLKITEPRIKLAVESLLTLKTHQSTAVHVAFIEFCFVLLSNTCSNLKSIRTILIETMLYYSVAEIESTRTQAIDNIFELDLKSDVINELKNVFQEKLRLIGRAIGSENSESILCLCGYQKFFQHSIPEIEALDFTVIASSATLLECGHLETGSGSLKYAFKRPDSFILSISLFLNLLGKFGNLRYMVNGFLSLNTCESMWCLNEIVRGIDQIDANRNSHQSPTPILLDISDTFSSILKSCNQTENQNQIPRTMKLLSMDGISYIASHLKQSYQLFLESLLSHFIQYIGDDDPILSQCSTHNLKKIAICFNYNSSHEMIVDNFDYIQSALGVRVNEMHVDPKIAQIMCGVVEVVGEACFVLVGDIIDDLMDSLDIAYGRNTQVCISIVKALKAFVSVQSGPKIRSFNTSECIKEVKFSRLIQRVKDCEDSRRENEELKESKSIDEIESYFKKQNELKTLEKAKEAGSTDKLRSESEESEEKIRKLLLPHQNVTLRIAQRTYYCINSDCPRVRTLSLDLVGLSVGALAGCPLSLNPLIHSIWPSVTKRLNDPEFYVKIACFQLIIQLCLHAKSFITRRIIQDVWPLLDYMSLQIKQKLSKTNPYCILSSSTVELKTQKAFIDCVCVFASQIELGTVHLHKIVGLMWNFLDDKEYSKDIQALALNCIRVVTERNGDMAWLLKEVSIGRM